MSNTYKISLLVNNNKVAFIKMIRDFVEVGLKEAKDFVEDHFEGEYASHPDVRDEKVLVELYITDNMLGRATRRAFTHSITRSWKIHAIDGSPISIVDLERARLARGW